MKSKIKKGENWGGFYFSAKDMNMYQLFLFFTVICSIFLKRNLKQEIGNYDRKEMACTYKRKIASNKKEEGLK